MQLSLLRGVHSDCVASKTAGTVHSPVMQTSPLLLRTCSTMAGCSFLYNGAPLDSRSAPASELQGRVSPRAIEDAHCSIGSVCIPVCATDVNTSIPDG